MKEYKGLTLLDLIILFFIIFCFQECTETKIKQSETRTIEAIQKQNDSINAVKYLNRENHGRN